MMVACISLTIIHVIMNLRTSVISIEKQRENVIVAANLSKWDKYVTRKALKV